MFVELSHSPENNVTGREVGVPELKIHWRARFGDGQNKSNQTSSIEIFSHHGSHVDTPLHVFPDGKSVKDFKVTDFIFQRPLLVQAPKDDFQEITPRDLEPYEKSLQQCDLVLISTGFSKYRGQDPKRYVRHAPGFSFEGAEYLVQTATNARCVGVDVISVENIDQGRKNNWPVHKALLGSRPDFLAIEDIQLSPIEGRHIKQVFALPLLLPTEAAPVTVIAEVD